VEKKEKKYGVFITLDVAGNSLEYNVYVTLCIIISFNCRQLYKNNKGILNGEYMHSGCWTLGRDFGETPEVVDMMTRPIHPSTPLNFLLENQDGAKTTV
jgi:hypothetical protein